MFSKRRFGGCNCAPSLPAPRFAGPGWGGNGGGCDIRRQICGPMGGNCGGGGGGGIPPRLPGQGAPSANTPYAAAMYGQGQFYPGSFQSPWDAALWAAQRVTDPVQGNNVYFGMDSSTALGAGLTATLTTSPQVRNIPKRIVVPDTLTSTFLIANIKVGVQPVLASNSAISAAIFDSDSTAQAFKAVILEVGMDFSMDITNISAGALRFVATVEGTDLACYPC